MPLPQQPITWRGRPFRGIIFDMDGVIADTRDAHAKAWEEFAHRENVPIDIHDFMLKTFGRGNNQVLEYFYPGRPFDAEFFARKGAEKEEIFLDLLRAGAVPPVPGLTDFINRLVAAGLKLSIGSSAPRRNINATISTFRIDAHFPIIVSMEDVVHAKPDPEIFLLCCKRMGLLPAECIVIEDSMHGLEAARNADCPAIGITTMHKAHEIAHLCEFSAPDFNQLLKSDFGRALGV